MDRPRSVRPGTPAGPGNVAMDVRENREILLERIPWLKIGVIVALTLIGSSYWFVQVVRGVYYRELAENNRLKKLTIKSPRGLIYDRHEELLVDNVPSYNLLIDRSQAAALEESLEFAADVLDTPHSDLKARVARQAGSASFTPLLLAESLTLSQVAHFRVASLEHPEFDVEVDHLRSYRHGELTAHVLGYLSEVGEEELKGEAELYRPGDLVGRKGVERTFNMKLRGAAGERVVVVDSQGRLQDEQSRENPEPGRSLALTLDLQLQQEAARYFVDKVGAAVVLDPRNGEILVLVSSPSYNPNLFARRLDQEQWRGLLEAPHDPLQNRTIQNAYAPGSVFKIAMATAGLTEKTVRREEVVYCGGATTIYNQRFRCWKRSGHGWVDLREAIKESCDVYFYHLGQKLGIETIAKYSRLFGLGGLTGIDIPGERSGLVPDTEWKLRRYREPWYPGETISVAIGQGALLVTPLQMATMAAAVANGGYRVTPHLVRDEETPAPEFVGLDPDALDFVREALWAVVSEQGTGAAAFVEGADIAGKTGTAQVVRQKTWTESSELRYEERDHAWFASFAPAGDREAELVVVVFVEHGGKGSQAAAPLARSLYESFYRAGGHG